MKNIEPGSLKDVIFWGVVYTQMVPRNLNLHVSSN